MVPLVVDVDVDGPRGAVVLRDAGDGVVHRRHRLRAARRGVSEHQSGLRADRLTPRPLTVTNLTCCAGPPLRFVITI